MSSVPLIALVVLTLTVAGRTSPTSPSQPVTTLPTPISTVSVTSPSEIPSQERVGNWILVSMTTGEDSPIITPATAINLTIGNDGNLTGMAGATVTQDPI